MSAMRDVLTVFQNIWNDFVKMVKGKAKEQKNDKFTQAVFFVAIIVGIGYGGFRAYRWYIANRESKAQKIFSESMNLYLQARSDSEKWEDVEGALSLGYEQNENSSLAHFFQLFQADAFLRQGKRVQAIELMEKAINKAPKYDPLIPMYRVKLSLVKIDSEDDAIRSVGLQELENCSENDDSARDMALFFLGSYYWQLGEQKKAKELWEKISAEKEGFFPATSPFPALVKDRLEQVG